MQFSWKSEAADHWRIERADRMTVIVDAKDYFHFARLAMLKAEHRIQLIGWDFDAGIVLDHDGVADGEPRTLGAFISWLVEQKPELEIYILRWDKGAWKALLRGKTIFTLLRWLRHPRIHTRLDGHHPTGGSHHQKIVVIDECLAFCGGIDMTSDRWDTRAHLDDQPQRTRSFGRTYSPWHDAITALEGPIATALSDLFRERWHAAGAGLLSPAQPGQDCWPNELVPDFKSVEVKIARTFPEMPDENGIHESEALFLKHIGSARHHLYIESQYFASRRIAEAVAHRLGDPDGPEIVIINPRTAQGWLEPIAMDTARARLMGTLWKRDTYKRLRMYHPYTAGGNPIYCHAKILIADDRVLRLGSSNLNNRSMRLDTECDVAIEPDDDQQRACITMIRNGLIAEHLGVDHETVSDQIEGNKSLIAAIEALRGKGATLVPYEIPNLNAVEEWLADNEILDPEGPHEMFEPIHKRSLFRRLRKTGQFRHGLKPSVLN